MEDTKENIPINADEMECLILKYMKKHDVKKREATRIVCANGFSNHEALKDSMK